MFIGSKLPRLLRGCLLACRIAPVVAIALLAFGCGTTNVGVLASLEKTPFGAQVQLPVTLQEAQTVTIDLSLRWGAAPFTVTWDMGGGATPNTLTKTYASANISESFSLLNDSGAAKQYAYVLRITDSTGDWGEVVGNYTVDPLPALEYLRLTLFHNNDGESQLINAGAGLEDFGGVARFKTKLNELRNASMASQATNYTYANVTVSSGDNFLAGPEFNASLQAGKFYDALALDALGYDAICLGNHDFDFGPQLLAQFISAYPHPVKYLSCNLSFSGVPELQAHADAGRVVRSLVVERSGHKIGIIGATTPELKYISSPGATAINADVAGAIQQQVAQLTTAGAKVIILISHLQSVQNDLDLAPLLHGVDIMVAGGGDELLANPGDVLIPGDTADPALTYPLTATDADGNELPVVTTAGDYRYLGMLTCDFDPNGELVSVVPGKSGPVRIAGGAEPDAVAADAALAAQVVEPIQASLASLAANVIATSEVALDGTRSPGVRTMETNAGNLVADALLWQARELAADYGAPLPQVALQNGGGIRNNTVIAAGDVTELNTFEMLPFANFVSIVENVPPAQFKQLLENAVSQVEISGGRFAQVAGCTFTYDPAGTAQIIGDTGAVTTPGSRVVDA